MTRDLSLAFRYRDHERVNRLIDVLTYHLESISLEFDRWGESRVYGPGMYLAVFAAPSVDRTLIPWAQTAGRLMRYGNRWRTKTDLLKPPQK